jgi:hypothetical protein
VDVPATYANPSTEPDSEHFCLALLVLEGAVSHMPSANWDGLIERAVEVVAPGQAALVVCVVSSDLRNIGQQATLYKFHGCAVRARDDAAVYRSKLIARFSQINSWAVQADNRVIVNRLVDIAATKRSLMLGLSLQDGNIQNIFALAEAMMPWEWPIDPPAYAFSEDQLGFDQRSLLQNVYRAGYTPASREHIYGKALIRAYAKPLLAALSLHVIFSKLERLLKLAPSNLRAADRATICAGLKRLRNLLADATDPPLPETVLSAMKQFMRIMAMFHDGDALPGNLRYRPITPRPIQHLAADATLATCWNARTCCCGRTVWRGGRQLPLVISNRRSCFDDGRGFHHHLRGQSK